jgi:hypothetical protein
MNALYASEHVAFRNYKAIANGEIPNNDGFDCMDGCYNVLIEDVFVRGTDDILSVKHNAYNGAGSPYWRTKSPNGRVTLREALIAHAGNTIRIGAETSGPLTEWIVADGLEVLTTGTGLQVLPMDNVLVRNVIFRNIRMHEIALRHPGNTILCAHAWGGEPLVQGRAGVRPDRRAVRGGLRRSSRRDGGAPRGSRAGGPVREHSLRAHLAGRTARQGHARFQGGGGSRRRAFERSRVEGGLRRRGASRGGP